MDKREHLLTIFSEECAEVAQRVSKALRFGTSEIQPGQPWSNGQRIGLEFADLMAVWDMLIDEGVLSPPESLDRLIYAKREKVLKYMDYSRGVGTLR